MIRRRVPTVHTGRRHRRVIDAMSFGRPIRRLAALAAVREVEPGHRQRGEGGLDRRQRRMVGRRAGAGPQRNRLHSRGVGVGVPSRPPAQPNRMRRASVSSAIRWAAPWSLAPWSGWASRSCVRNARCTCLASTASGRAVAQVEHTERPRHRVADRLGGERERRCRATAEVGDQRRTDLAAPPQALADRVHDRRPGRPRDRPGGVDRTRSCAVPASPCRRRSRSRHRRQRLSRRCEHESQPHPVVLEAVTQCGVARSACPARSGSSAEGVLVPVLVEIAAKRAAMPPSRTPAYPGAGSHGSSSRPSATRRVGAIGREKYASASASSMASTVPVATGGRFSRRPAAGDDAVRCPVPSDVLTHQVPHLRRERPELRRRRATRRRRARPRWPRRNACARPTSACHWGRSNPKGSDIFSMHRAPRRPPRRRRHRSAFLVSLPVARKSLSRTSCNSMPIGLVDLAVRRGRGTRRGSPRPPPRRRRTRPGHPARRTRRRCRPAVRRSPIVVMNAADHVPTSYTTLSAPGSGPVGSIPASRR